MIAFEWDVAVEGYEWVTDGNDGTPLKPGEMGTKGERGYPRCHLEPLKNAFRKYVPPSGLFRIFAETPPDPAGILAFVNQYGHLGDTVGQT